MAPSPPETLLTAAVADGVFPGGVLLVADQDAVVRQVPFGQLARVPAAGPPVTATARYDVASLTKAVATTAVVMRLVETGQLALETPARKWVPELTSAGTEQVTIRHLLCHAAGFTAWKLLYDRLPTSRDAILRRAAGEPLEAAPGTRSLYSDLGFIVLGFAAERAGGARLDELARRLVFAPLGMPGCAFVDLAARPRSPLAGDVAPTEVDAQRGLIVGEVHDENCHAAGGILGHAGLFATAADVSTLCAALSAAWRGEVVPGGFPPELVRTFLSPCGVPGSTWRLGWDGPSPGASQAGTRWPRTGVGHLGFTGCSVWIDPPRGRWVVLLTNRVHPSRDDQRIKDVRPRLHDAVVEWLDGPR